ncbi:unnamed protein product, partial [Vitis vinifera]
MSSSNSPCAACKLQRRKCTQECIYAPYFPPDQPQKFANVHKVFGASNVAKLLNEINAANREDAVNSLAYEAEARLHDPVYGCVGMISILQQQLKHLQNDLLAAKKELAAYIGPSAMAHVGYMPQQYMSDPSSSSVIPYNMSPILGLPPGAPHGGQLIIHFAFLNCSDPMHLILYRRITVGYWQLPSLHFHCGQGPFISALTHKVGKDAMIMVFEAAYFFGETL